MSAPSNASAQSEPPLQAEQFRFVIPGRLEYRDAATAVLSFVCDRLAHRGALTKDVGHRVISAFLEAYSNSVRHAYAEIDNGAVEIELDVTSDRLYLRVIDRGAGFDATTVPEPDLDSLPEGGMGLFIMRSFMDNVEYHRDGERNVVSMEKALTPIPQG